MVTNTGETTIILDTKQQIYEKEIKISQQHMGEVKVEKDGTNTKVSYSRCTPTQQKGKK